MVDRYVVGEMIRNELDRLSVEKHCPVCKGYVTMAKICFIPDDGKWDDDTNSETFKCLKCDNVFSEELKKV
jgi:hypothetical protein